MAKASNETPKKKAGRPPASATGEVQKAYTVKIVPSRRDFLVNKYGSLSKALNSKRLNK